MSDHRFTNRLAAETSPYLLQHAHNPVDWHAWGTEAFELARRENKPIFISVGYSTCYWCHVMERECFENPAIAEEMNRRFVNIKVDREERPDVDQLYMSAVQLMTRQGGWPMSVFLTPDLRPFYGGTYFPPADSHGRPGFGRLMGAISDAFSNRPGEVNESAEQVVNILRQMARPQETAAKLTIDEGWVIRLIERSGADFDAINGGFGGAPKFPRQTLLELMLVYLRERKNPGVLNKVRVSLDAMAHGGIRDQLGGGFHRYSTDAQWLVPHFEIMLYDNAMLLWIYAEAHSQTRDARYAAVARGIADFVLREMTSPQGAFYTALDAEVEAREGASYLWTREEIEAALEDHGSKAEIARFLEVYGVDDGPNFSDPHHGTGTPDKNILYVADTGQGERATLLDGNLKGLREVLRAARGKRKQPMLDQKILTGWNALMIRGLAHAGEVLGEARYTAAAVKGADFLLANHRDAEGGLLRVSAGGAAKYHAFLDDYAGLIQALLAIARGEDANRRREQAREIAEIMGKRFGAGEGGGFYYSDERADDLIVRQMVGTDSPLPSGNGVAAAALLELGEAEAAERTIAAFAAQMENGGEGMSGLVQAALLYVRQRGEIAVEAGKISESDRPLSPAELASKVVLMAAAWDDATHLSVACKVLKNFHINAYDAKSPLQGARLMVNGAAAGAVDSIAYPPGVKRKLGFSAGEVSVYEGVFVITVKFKTPQDGGEKVGVSLSYQACDDRACLPGVVKGASAEKLEVPHSKSE